MILCAAGTPRPRSRRRSTSLWTTPLGVRPEGTITEDWTCNYFIRGPLGPPVAAGAMVYVTRPDAHQVVAMDCSSGQVRWSFTANGRVDTAPTIHRGLCLFGCKSGWVYCLRADSGAMVWRMRIAPFDERIVAYGQIESPWPAPGSVLVIDDVAYCAAGRQSLADGGIVVLAFEPVTGKVRWRQRLDTLPQTEFYGSSGLEFDNFDLLHQEGDSVAMSRWLFDRSSGKISCQAKSGYARLASEDGSVMFPRGAWSYAPRNESGYDRTRPFVRPLAVFQGSALYGCSQDRQTVFRRDFHLETGEKFDSDWFAGWATWERARKGGDTWRSQRLAHDATWNVTPWNVSVGKDKKLDRQSVSAMVLAGDRLYLASAAGRLIVLNPDKGSTVSQLTVPPPVWDGLAAAGGRLFLATQEGSLVCLGKKE